MPDALGGPGLCGHCLASWSAHPRLQSESWFGPTAKMRTQRPGGQGPQKHTAKADRGCWVPSGPKAEAEPPSVALGPPGALCRVTVSGHDAPTHTWAHTSGTQPPQPQDTHMWAPSPGTHPAATPIGHTPRHMRAPAPTQSSGYHTVIHTPHTRVLTQAHTCASPCRACLCSQDSQTDFRKMAFTWSPGQPDCRGVSPYFCPCTLGTVR